MRGPWLSRYSTGVGIRPEFEQAAREETWNSGDFADYFPTGSDLRAKLNPGGAEGDAGWCSRDSRPECGWDLPRGLPGLACGQRSPCYSEAYLEKVHGASRLADIISPIVGAEAPDEGLGENASAWETSKSGDSDLTLGPSHYLRQDMLCWRG